jgi:hypothetical protein
MKSKAELQVDNRQLDVLYLESILISTGPNRNDDLFMPRDIYNAMSSIKFKPVDWNHNIGDDKDSSEVIGVLSDAWFETLKGQKIEPESFDDMPVEFNVATQAMIWKYYFENRADELLKGFDDKQYSVSMEMWFWKYDYALRQEDNTYKIVKRNKTTAALNKHLRIAGGDGLFKNQRIYRVPRDFIFGGMGIVAKPANKRSEIKDIVATVISRPESELKMIDCTNLYKSVIIS